MERTTNYKLPQWVEEDRILMDDFNKAFESIENGLTEIKAAAEGANEKAVEGVQLANTAQDIANGNCIVKLKEEKLAEAKSVIQIDLQAVDLTKYCKLILEVYGRTSDVNGNSTLTLRLNNSSSAVYYSRSIRDTLSQMVISDQGRYIASKVELSDMEGMVMVRYESVSSTSGVVGYNSDSAGVTTLCGMQDIASIQLLVAAQAYNYLEGSWYKLYGVKA